MDSLTSEQHQLVSDDSSWNMLEVIARVSPERFDFFLFVMAGKMGGGMFRSSAESSVIITSHVGFLI